MKRQLAALGLATSLLLPATVSAHYSAPEVAVPGVRPTATPVPPTPGPPTPVPFPTQPKRAALGPILWSPTKYRLAYPVKGVVFYYNQASLVRTGQLHGVPWRADVDGYTAHRDCGMLGKVAYLVLPYASSTRLFRLQIRDCTAPADLATHIAIRNIGEINRELARRIPGLLAHGKVPGTLLGVRNN